MSSFNGAVPTPYFFDFIQVLLDEVGPSDERYIWWSQSVRASLGLQCLFMDTFCAGPEPAYPPMNAESIAALGLKEVFRLWMMHFVWTKYTIPS